MLDAFFQNFFRASTLYRVGGERTVRRFRKGCTVLRGNREITEKYEYCSTVPRTFVQDCRSNFPESELLLKGIISQANTDETFLWLAQNILAKLQFNHAITYLSTPCGNHTIAHFRCTDKTIHNHA